jgi:hypothetical protein
MGLSCIAFTENRSHRNAGSSSFKRLQVQFVP